MAEVIQELSTNNASLLGEVQSYRKIFNSA
jgi:hypothetical protein